MVLLVVLAIAALAIFLQYFVSAKKPIVVRQLGEWAVVTGATDGIGKSFTHELAMMKMNIVLLSRNIKKLVSCAKEIEERFGVSTKVIQADFTSLDEDMYSRIRRELAEMDIGVLVNNVGMLHQHPDHFHMLDAHHGAEFQDLINCNITSAVNMTRFVLRGMVAKRRGLIINISSVTSKIPSPLITTYAATKSFLAKMSRDLNTEYKSFGIQVHVLRTGFVATKLSEVSEWFGVVPSPEVYVRTALKETLSNSDCDGYFGHWATRIVVHMLEFIAPSICLGFIKNLYIRRQKDRVRTCENCNSTSVS